MFGNETIWAVSYLDHILAAYHSQESCLLSNDL